MDTNRLVIRPMADSDQKAFTEGIADPTLRVAYGFPKDMDKTAFSKLFHRFRGLTGAYSVVEKQDGNMVGFLLDVDTELPEGIAKQLPGKGRTLAFAISTISAAWVYGRIVIDQIKQKETEMQKNEHL